MRPRSPQEHSLPDAPHILVRGHAEVDVVPDRFTIHLRITDTDPSPGKARAQVEQHVNALLKSIDSHHAMAKLTRASSLSIGDTSRYENGRTVHVGTEVDRRVTATFDRLEDLRRFISDLPSSSHVLVQSTDVARSDRSRIRQKLRRQAIANSRQAACHLAKAYGMRIRGIYSISEVAPNFAYGIQAGQWGSGTSPMEQTAMSTPPEPPAPPAASTTSHIPTQLRVGTITFRQNMYAVYLIAPDDKAH